jgi:membrane protease YdiL (CAAX protease family)
VFAVIMAYIWVWRASIPNLWVAILGFMLLSHVLRRERPCNLGFARCETLFLVRRFGPIVAAIALLLIFLGAFFRTIRPISPGQATLALAAYLPWGLLQQYMLNGYFLNRFTSFMPPCAAVTLSASLFALAHTPNWFLMPVTFAGGYCSSVIYRRHRCLYLLGIAHGIIGFLLFLVVPDSISHHLRVGPGWFRW